MRLRKGQRSMKARPCWINTTYIDRLERMEIPHLCFEDEVSYRDALSLLNQTQLSGKNSKSIIFHVFS
jgi:hypothetical protein